MLRWKVPTSKCLYAEMSSRRNVLMAKCPIVNCPWAIFPSAKVPINNPIIYNWKITLKFNGFYNTSSPYQSWICIQSFIHYFKHILRNPTILRSHFVTCNNLLNRLHFVSMFEVSGTQTSDALYWIMLIWFTWQYSEFFFSGWLSHCAPNFLILLVHLNVWSFISSTGC